MNSTTIVILVVACMAFASFGLAALVWLTWDSGDPAYKDLPTEPPKLPPNLFTTFPKQFRDFVYNEVYPNLVHQFYNTTSDCWHFNHFMRVTNMNMSIDILKRMSTIKLTKATYTMATNMPPVAMAYLLLTTNLSLDYKRLHDANIAALQKCPSSATITMSQKDGSKQIYTRPNMIDKVRAEFIHTK